MGEYKDLVGCLCHVLCPGGVSSWQFICEFTNRIRRRNAKLSLWPIRYCAHVLKCPVFVFTHADYEAYFRQVYTKESRLVLLR